MIEIQISDRQNLVHLDRQHVEHAVRAVLQNEGIQQAVIGVAIVDDRAIHLLNRKFLNHDYATDVLSFVLESAPLVLEGEIVVSAETALSRCTEFGWTAHDELLLYVVHGSLHLVGYDDGSQVDRDLMRKQESEVLSRLRLRAHRSVIDQ